MAKLRLGLAIAGLLAVSGSSCDLVLGLGSYKSCPEDNSCPATTGSGGAGTSTATGGTTTTSTTASTTTVSSSSSSNSSSSTGNPLTGPAEWVDDFGSPNVSQASGAIAVDPSGNVIIGGGLNSGPIAFGSTMLSSSGGTDALVSKLDKMGAVKWAKSFGDGSNQVVTGIATDASGNVFITGTFVGTINFGGPDWKSADTSTTNTFVAMFNSSGVYQWSKGFGDPVAGHMSSAKASAIAIDPSGNPVIVGTYNGTLDFGNGVLPAAPSYGSAIFLAKLASINGSAAWSVPFAGNGGSFDSFVPRALAIGASGNIAFGGNYSSSFKFGSATFPTQGNAFVAMTDAQGSPKWAIPGGSSVNLYGLALDTTGNVVISASAGGGGGTTNADFGCGDLGASNQNLGLVLAQLSPLGTCVWSTLYTNGVAPMGTTHQILAPAVALATTGDILVSGRYFGQPDLGTGPFPAPVVSNAIGTFVARFGGAMHTNIWSHGFGDASNDGVFFPFVPHVARNDADGPVILGPHGGNWDYGKGNVSAVGNIDLLVASFGP